MYSVPTPLRESTKSRKDSPSYSTRGWRQRGDDAPGNVFGATVRCRHRSIRHSMGNQLQQGTLIRMAKLLFLQNLHYEFLGPMYVASALRERKHDARLALGNTAEDFDSIIKEYRPDLVGFSIMSGSHRWALKIARAIREKHGIGNVFGGAHPTFFPKFLEEGGVDFIIRGEGEFAAADLLDAFPSGGSVSHIANLGYKKDGQANYNDVRALPQNLDDYPMPDRQIYASLEGKIDRSIRNVLTSRGCPFHCSFCFEDAMREMYNGKGKYVRMRDIDKVIEECRILRETTNVKVIYFADDLFGMDKPWLYEFLARYKKEIGLPFVCLVRADLVASDETYARKLAEGGCQNVFFGVESGNEELRNKVLRKKLTDQEIYRAGKLLHEAGIKFRTYNIMGLPGETLEDAFKTVQINIDIQADYPWCSVFSPIPGVALTDYAIQQGYLPEAFNASDINQSFFLDNALELPQKREIQNLQKFFQTAVRWPWLFPIVKRIIQLPPNPGFTLWFGFMYFVNYIKSEKKNFRVTLGMAIRNWRFVLAKQ